MLDELCPDYHYERNYAIKLLGDTLPPPSGRQQPGPEPKHAAVEPIVRPVVVAAVPSMLEVDDERMFAGVAMDV